MRATASEDETLRSFDPDMVGYVAPELLVSNLTVREDAKHLLETLEWMRP